MQDRLRALYEGTGQPHEGPVRAQIKCYFPRGPQSFPSHNGDVDNLAKMVLDAFNSVVYVDDRQVVSLSIDKDFCADGTNPRTEVVFLLETDDESPPKSSEGKKRKRGGSGSSKDIAGASIIVADD